jgi:hypothetical protein
MNGVGLPQTPVWLEISEGTGREGESGRERVTERGRGRVCDRDASQPLMVRTFLKVYMELGSYFLFLQEQIKDIIIIW